MTAIRSPAGATLARPSRTPLGTLLVADPDPSSCAAVLDVCASLDVALVHCRDGADALLRAGRLAPALVVVSVQLPLVPAPVVVATLRRHDGTPVTLGVGAGQAEFAAAAVAAGADTILTSPYRAAEVHALLTGPRSSALDRHRREAVLTVGALQLDGPAYQVLAAGQPLDLSVRDFELLRLLMLHAGRVVSVEQIRREVWAGEGASGNTIAVHVRRLRLQLRGEADVVSVRGIGYRLVGADGRAERRTGSDPARSA